MKSMKYNGTFSLIKAILISSTCRCVSKWEYEDIKGLEFTRGIPEEVVLIIMVNRWIMIDLLT